MATDKSTRPAKLTKTNSNSKLDFTSDVPDDETFRACFEDLKTSTNRASLRQHFTGAFPETQLRPSLGTDEPIVETEEMRGHARPLRSTSNESPRRASSGLSSSSSTSVNSAEYQRLATVRETNRNPNVSEVIKILQELRRTASPEELVALHKALLPTSDSVVWGDSSVPPSPVSGEEKPSVPASSFVRSRSLLPPGVKTRSSSPLKSPSDGIPRKPRLPRPRTEPVSSSKAVVTDLSNDQTSHGPVRAATPVDFDVVQMGAYRSGTLRITNGSASPEPCIIRSEPQLPLSASVKVGDEFQTAPSTPSEQHPLNLPQVSRRLSASRVAILAFNEKRQQHDKHWAKHSFNYRSTGPGTTRRASEPTISGLSAISTSEVSLIGPDTPDATLETGFKVCEHIQRRSHSRSESSKDQKVFQLPTGSTESGSGDSNRGLFQHYSNNSHTALEDRSTDEGRKAGLPRFAQRWSHRISHISPELPSAAQFDASQRTGTSARRRSSIQPETERTKTHISIADSEQGRENIEGVESTDNETPDVALARLTGEAGKRAASNVAHDSCSSPSSPVEDGAAIRPRSKDDKIDSGYGSDISPHPNEQQIARKVDKTSSHSLESGTEHTHKAYGGLPIDDDEVSLYSINHVLRSPYLLSGIAKPSPPSARGSKKHLSLLGIDKETQSDASPDQSVGPTVSGMDKPDPSKPYKKLQKRIPLSIRNSLRGDARRRETQRNRLSMTRFPMYDDLEDFLQISGNAIAMSTADSYAEPAPLEDPKLHSDKDNVGRNSVLQYSHEQTGDSRKANVNLDRNNTSDTLSKGPDLCIGGSENSSSRTFKASRDGSGISSQIKGCSDQEAERSNERKIRDITAGKGVDAQPSNDTSSATLAETKSDARTMLYQCRAGDQQPTDEQPRTHSKRLSGIEFLMASGVARVSSRDLAKITSREAVEQQKKRASKTAWSKRFSIQGASVQTSRDKHSNVQQQETAGEAVHAIDSGPLPGHSQRIMPTSKPMSAKADSSYSDVTATEGALPHGRAARAKMSPSGAASAGDDVESIADVVKKTVRSRNAHDKPANAPQRRDNVYVSEAAKVEEEKKLSQARRVEPPSSARKLLTQKPVWNQHAKAWQLRRESLQEQLRRPVMVDLTEQLRSTGETDLRPPAITVSGP